MAIGRALLGLIKGLIVGGGIGYCLLKLGNPNGVFIYICCGLVGAVVGLLCGKAPWQAETIWTPILKVLFGLLAGTGLYALGHRFMPGFAITIQGYTEMVPLRSGAFLAVAIGAIYGMFVEVDDGGGAARKAKLKALSDAEAID
jgi:hypothetical protein